MAWPTDVGIWGGELPFVRDEIRQIARAVSSFEHVSMLVAPEDVADAASQLGSEIEVVELPVRDCWIRDSGPVFMVRQHELGAVSLNFNGWGEKQSAGPDAHVAERMADHLNCPLFVAPLVGEGGSLQFDSSGAIMASLSSLVNDNRNPWMSRKRVEETLLAWFGRSNLIWIPGGWREITDGHVDGFARFVHPNVLLVEIPAGDLDRVSRANLSALQDARTASGGEIEIVTMVRPSVPWFSSRESTPSRINYYLANGAVITPSFPWDPYQDEAFRVISALFPDRKLVPVMARHLARGGGGVHCVTLEQPSVAHPGGS